MRIRLAPMPASIDQPHTELPHSKLRNLISLAVALLAFLELARLAFVWKFGSLAALLTPDGRSSLYIGLSSTCGSSRSYLPRPGCCCKPDGLRQNTRC